MYSHMHTLCCNPKVTKFCKAMKKKSFKYFVLLPNIYALINNRKVEGGKK